MTFKINYISKVEQVNLLKNENFIYSFSCLNNDAKTPFISYENAVEIFKLIKIGKFCINIAGDYSNECLLLVNSIRPEYVELVVPDIAKPMGDFLNFVQSINSAKILSSIWLSHDDFAIDEIYELIQLFKDTDVAYYDVYIDDYAELSKSQIKQLDELSNNYPILFSNCQGFTHSMTFLKGISVSLYDTNKLEDKIPNLLCFDSETRVREILALSKS